MDNLRPAFTYSRIDLEPDFVPAPTHHAIDKCQKNNKLIPGVRLETYTYANVSTHKRTQETPN
jgi:hypothetical protein